MVQTNMILSFLHKLRKFPELLTNTYPSMIDRLRKSSGQGTGNIPTSQEACFAVELEKHGFTFLLEKEALADTGAYFRYQPNGTQRSIDFVLIEKYNDTEINVLVDLKHSQGKTFYWNDGWFEKGVIYIISFVMKKKPYVYIGYGEHSCSEEETNAIQKRRELIHQLNKESSKVGFLRLYSRQANQYSCEKFTPEVCDEQFAIVEQSLTSSEQEDELM